MKTTNETIKCIEIQNTYKEKKTKGMVIELDWVTKGDLTEIQSRYFRLGVKKTTSEIALDCLKIGIFNKLTNTEKE